MIVAGSKFSKLKLRFYGPGYRGVHARRDIRAGEDLLFVPRENMITLEMSHETPIGRKMIKHCLHQQLSSPKHSFLASFLLQEKRNTDTEWVNFFDILPHNFSAFPVFFTKKEKEWLKGSPFLNQVEMKMEELKNDYELICSKIPE